MSVQKFSKKWLGIAALACAACCAVPIAAVLGVGGAASAGAWFNGAWSNGAMVETIVCLGGLAAMASGVWFVWRKRGAQSVDACTASCSTDASCCEGESRVAGK